MRHHHHQQQQQYLHCSKEEEGLDSMMNFHDIDSSLTNNNGGVPVRGSSGLLDNDSPPPPAFCSSYFQNQRRCSDSSSFPPSSMMMMPLMTWNTTSPVLETSSGAAGAPFMSLVEKTLEDVIAMFDDGAFEPTPIREGGSGSSSSFVPLLKNVQVVVSSSSECEQSLSSSDSSNMNCLDSSLSSMNDDRLHLEDSTTEEQEVSMTMMSSSSKKKRIIKKAKTTSSPPIKKKKAVSVTAAAACGSDKYSPKFRVYQKEKWWERYEELVDFYQVHKHSQVGIEKSASKALVRWVKRQRYQYRLLKEGKPSSMTTERIKALDEVDFVWDSHGNAWDDHFQELVSFKLEKGHCNVSARYPQNQSLASWVKHQRRQYRMFENGEPTNMTNERIFKLEKMGFQWRLRKQQQQSDTTTKA